MCRLGYRSCGILPVKLAWHRSRYAYSKQQGGAIASGNLHGSHDGSSEIVTEPGYLSQLILLAHRIRPSRLATHYHWRASLPLC